MIASLQGTPTRLTDKFIVLEVGGVGYKVFASVDTIEFARGSSDIFLFIHTVVREDAFELFGFRDENSLSLFEKLISVSGIGPRGALGIFSFASTSDIISAIISSDLNYLTKFSGVGKKTAEKIILELKDKLTVPGFEGSFISRKEDSDLVLALESLGYSQSEIREVVKSIDKNIDNTQDKIKEALKHLKK